MSLSRSDFFVILFAVAVLKRNLSTSFKTVHLIS